MKTDTFQTLRLDPAAIANWAFGPRGRLVILGSTGSGKSTLAAGLAQALCGRGQVYCLSADPGSPPFGVPGAVNLGIWRNGKWELARYGAVCSLDAVRFRMPLVACARGLMAHVPDGAFLIVDPPGVYRGQAGAELFEGITSAVKATAVVILAGADGPVPLANEIAALGLPTAQVPPALRAKSPSGGERDIARTRLWGEHLRTAERIVIDPSSAPIIGAPPPLAEYEAWEGRQVALLAADGEAVAMGEAISMGPEGLAIRASRPTGPWRSLLVRDAKRDVKGHLKTSRAERLAARAIPPDMAPGEAVSHGHDRRYAVRLGQASALLLNGVFGDPLLHLRLRDQKRSLLFDLGEATRLPGRIAHQVSDVFISHTHMDHIGGFLWLLRSRIGLFPPCRLYGPPGLCANIQGMIDGVHWDRVGDRGPAFIIAEIAGEKMSLFRVQAGSPKPEPMGEKSVVDGIIVSEESWAIRAVTLDHGIPSIAYGFEQPATLNIRKDALVTLGLPAGKWLAELKLRVLRGEMGSLIAPPGAPERTVGDLAEALILRSPGSKLVYATDLGDTPSNRERLIELAHGADVLFLEASFAQGDKDQANATWHLTARVCGEIAKSAGVRLLAPFHFSRRYERTPEAITREVMEVFPALLGQAPASRPSVRSR